MGWGKKLNHVNVKVVKVIFQESLRLWAPGFLGVEGGIFLFVVGAGTAFKFSFIIFFTFIKQKLFINHILIILCFL